MTMPVIPGVAAARARHVAIARTPRSGPGHCHGPWDKTPEGAFRCRRCGLISCGRHDGEQAGECPPRKPDGTYYAEYDIGDLLICRHMAGNLFALVKASLNRGRKLSYVDQIYFWAWNWGKVLGAMEAVENPTEDSLLDAAWMVVHQVPRPNRQGKDGFWRREDR